MREIGNKKKNMFSKLRRSFYDFRRDKCFRLRNFLVGITKNMCFEKREIEEIKDRVEVTKKKERKFDEFSGIAPEILRLIEGLKNDNDILKKEKEFCMNGIRDIYIAYSKNNIRELELIFGKFGLPFILENED